jgi:hypothetical protein
MVPEYLQRGAADGKDEEIARTEVFSESLNILRT